MSRKKRIPKNIANRPDRKQPRADIPKRDNKPSWRFSTVDRNGPFAWPIGTARELTIVEKLHSFDSMSWTQISGTNHHAIPINRLSRLAQTRLQEIELDDIEELFSFHLQGKPRIFCIRDMDIAKLLWYDPEHQVCPSKKKHT